ncbi:MAG: PAS domain S-box protein [Deltaproteobacteria bacterium]|nr:PAS domain S-box protein [Deltaproteobacteria bacterium]
MDPLKALLGTHLFDLVPEPVFALSPEARFLMVNQAAVRYLGRPAEEIVGREVGELFPPEQAARQREVIGRVLATGEPFLEERETPIGSQTFVFQYAVCRVDDPEGGPLGVLGMVRDVTALVRLERCYAELYERATDALFGVDREGRIRVINREAEALSGYPRDEVESFHFSKVVPPDEARRLRRYFEARLRGEDAPTQYEVRFVRKNGEERWAEVRISRETSSVGAFQASVRDITERKKLEALRREFLHLVGHDIKTPLTVIQGFAGALRSGVYGELPEPQQQCIEQILDASRRVASMVERFLLAERLAQEGAWEAKPGPAGSVFEAVARALRPAARERGVRLEVRTLVGADTMVADAEGFRHVVENLVSNAVKFTPAGGRVEARLERREGGIDLVVSDTGRGIPPQDRERLFERFFRASNAGGTAGSGLGLHIVKLLVDRAGGRLEVESEEGRGTTFRVWLPGASEPGGRQDS